MILKYLKNSDLFLLKIFNHTIKCKTLDLFMPLITYLGSFTFALIYCIVTIFSGNSFIKVLGINTLLTLVLSTIIVQITKTAVSRIRPFLQVQNLNIKKIGIDPYSFPSGHTAAAFSIAVSLSLLVPSLTIPSIILATLVGISRMYLGVHYPSDVIVGIILGALCSILMYFII